jgi:hypothetical protein
MVRCYGAAIGEGMDLCPDCAALAASRIRESREKLERASRLN